MNSCLPDQPTVQRLMAEIEAASPRPHHASLLAVTERLIPDCPCRFALTRGGWYRSGGLVRPDGERVAEHVETWVEQEMAACGDDLAEFLDRHGDGELLVTRHTGRTHYFVAPYGAGAAEFLQMEVEELQEVLDRRLWDAETPPEDAQELLDPLTPSPVSPQPLGPSRYHFRRLSDLRQVAARLPAPVGEAAPLVRFLREWEASRAGSAFCDHWVVGLREHHDRYNNVVLTAAPVSRHARELKPFPWNLGLTGVEAAHQLHAFDRAAGYPSAWYFHLVAGGLAPRDLAYQLQRDREAGYGYLADGEARLLEGWLQAPYSV